MILLLVSKGQLTTNNNNNIAPYHITTRPMMTTKMMITTTTLTNTLPLLLPFCCLQPTHNVIIWWGSKELSSVNGNFKGEEFLSNDASRWIFTLFYHLFSGFIGKLIIFNLDSSDEDESLSLGQDIRDEWMKRKFQLEHE